MTVEEKGGGVTVEEKGGGESDGGRERWRGVRVTM